MEKFEPLKVVKEQLERKKEEVKNSPDPIVHQKIEFISNMLNNERCFFQIQRAVAIEILSFLDFDDKVIFELYNQLTDYNLFAGNFNFVDIEEQQVGGVKKN